jgi:hypothetical protein
MNIVLYLMSYKVAITSEHYLDITTLPRGDRVRDEAHRGNTQYRRKELLD